MSRDNADAWNRALDDLANGVSIPDSDIDPELRATIQWFHDLGGQVSSPDPRFVDRLEQELMNNMALESPTGDSLEALKHSSSRVIHRGNSPAGPDTWRRSGRRWAIGALVWGAWALIIGIVAFALAGHLQLWPDSSSDSPALAPAVSTQADDTFDMSTHPIVGSWIPSPMAPRGFESFHADGTVIITNVLDGSGIGVWQATDERSGELIVLWPSRNVFEGEYREGRTVLRGTFTVADDGSTYTGTYHVETSTMIGTDVMVYEGESEGTRMTIERVATSTPEV